MRPAAGCMGMVHGHAGESAALAAPEPHSDPVKPVITPKLGKGGHIPVPMAKLQLTKRPGSANSGSADSSFID